MMRQPNCPSDRKLYNMTGEKYRTAARGGAAFPLLLSPLGFLAEGAGEKLLICRSMVLPLEFRSVIVNRPQT
eukprot:6550428-Pyramimonas_sp.AAC.1